MKVLGTDIVDQMVDQYTTATKSKRWTRKGFSYCIDVTRTNSQTVMAMNTNKNPRSVDSFRYGWLLALELIMPHIKK